jgi:hypothetical protein
MTKIADGDAQLRGRLATSAHNLRYVIFGGFVAFLVQIPRLSAEPSFRRTLAFLGISVSLTCLVMDWRNYIKYIELANLKGSGPPFGPVTALLTIFYVAWILWFATLLVPGWWQ